MRARVTWREPFLLVRPSTTLVVEPAFMVLTLSTLVPGLAVIITVVVVTLRGVVSL